MEPLDPMSPTELRPLQRIQATDSGPGLSCFCQSLSRLTCWGVLGCAGPWMAGGGWQMSQEHVGGFRGLLWLLAVEEDLGCESQGTGAGPYLKLSNPITMS